MIDDSSLWKHEHRWGGCGVFERWLSNEQVLNRPLQQMGRDERNQWDGRPHPLTASAVAKWERMATTGMERRRPP